MQPKFSIVVITKNEEKTLPRLLESLKEFRNRGGEICICDTGSTDGTVELAKNTGCKVDEVGSLFLIPIKNAHEINKRFIVISEENIVKNGDVYFNFSAARNYAASMAKNDVVFFYDADEVSVAMNIDRINQLIDEGIQQFEYNFVFAYDQFNNEAVKFIQCKAYDRRVISWHGIVHELLMPVEGTNPSRILLNENEYKLGHYQEPGTGRHIYLTGLAVDCFNNPDNDRHSHYLARELMWSGRTQSAIEEFSRHIEMNKWAAEKAQSCIFMGDCFGKLDLPENQISYYNKAFYFDSTRREALLRMANFYRHNNNPQAALCYALASTEIPYTGFYANHMSDYTYGPHEIMYWAYGWLGNIAKAQEHILKSLEYQPYNPIYLRDTKYYFEYGDNGLEGWMRFPEQQWLFETAKKYDKIVEVGSWKGKSTHALLSGCKGEVIAVDTWEGSADVKDLTNALAKQEDIFEVFKENTKQFPHLKTIRKSSVQAAADFEEGSIDFCFIDAGHTKEELLADIEAWLPKIKSTGIIAGHDYSNTWPGVMQAVNEKFGFPDGVCDSIWFYDLSRHRKVKGVEGIIFPKISIIIPQLGREDGLKKCLESIKLSDYPQSLIETIIVEGEMTVPEKIKEGVGLSTGEYIVYAANDMTFYPNCLLTAIKAAILQNKALVSFNEGPLLPDEGNICTHFLIRKDFIPQLQDGEVFSTKLSHVGVDNFLWHQASKLGQALYCPEAKIIHNHFSKGSTFDEVYARGWKNVEQDRQILNELLT